MAAHIFAYNCKNLGNAHFSVQNRTFKNSRSVPNCTIRYTAQTIETVKLVFFVGDMLTKYCHYSLAGMNCNSDGVGKG